ncbi:hypothetical protein [Mycolicibacterium wolinskyi]|uniref:ATP/GTP-binding protein n=1 Tax=Mycolicibacterium wolinskyi TaxID=59750 RepID=A0A132PCP0_9MYCO|nr:hypothetical protein [Mycolicibacterium wolinskyi]KWX20105.1 hypothetical protein AFM11_32655 [Mycolicibacterium wolinskyi]
MSRRRREPRRLPPLPPPRRIETGPDGYEYEVRAVTAARALKNYRCPGCDHEIRSGVAHVVVLPVELGDVDDRRHWHTSCWTNRANRSPTRRWS